MIIVSLRIVMFFDWLLRMNGSTAAMELLVLPFYIWYLIALNRKGYWNISHEREAYENERNLDYLKTRRPYSFLKY